ncbi:zinc finger protein 84-like [Artemia franciscana]|uniref:C2H2-type domain-containing protein n=1 Tax=Artemia franciscana TaxID=6661 RepID=A0AA88I6S5_ARTSF|nr:hypothetical protein QYM36_010801 [Artemia franciscana]KAK2716362.1 hypothetical protein QYM36_010801 [Artemia franciscana]
MMDPSTILELAVIEEDVKISSMLCNAKFQPENNTIFNSEFASDFINQERDPKTNKGKVCPPVFLMEDKLSNEAEYGCSPEVKLEEFSTKDDDGELNLTDEQLIVISDKMPIAKATEPQLLILEHPTSLDINKTPNSDCEEYFPSGAETQKPFTCEFCTNTFSFKSDLTRHIRIHTGEKPYQCDLCKKSFSRKYGLTCHRLKHTGENLFICEICQKKFSSRSNLTCHMSIHAEDKPFECEICGKKFPRRCNLNHHMIIHSKEKPYECEICERRFPKKSHLTYHSRTHTGEKPYECDICKKNFNRISNLNRHKRNHLGKSSIGDY